MTQLPRRPLYRPTPALPPQAMKTYHVARPLKLDHGQPGPGSHWRKATCQEVDCVNWRLGWQTFVDLARRAHGAIPSGRDQANYIRLHSGRRFTTAQNGDTVTFTFPPGQRCFVPHMAPVGRPPVFVVVDGDWRGNPRGTKPVVFRDHQGWLDDFGDHQNRLADTFQRG